MYMMSSDIREKFLTFFKEQGHTVVPSSSLIPDDPSVLLTTAGMQQFKPYYVGKADPMHDFGSKNVTSSQKSFRTSDIDDVGDATHLTFFEMLGNFSFGGYFKKEAIHLAYEFLVNELGIDRERMSVTVFGGWATIPADEESFKIWHEEIGIPADKIKKCGRKDNFWGPTGAEGPCGPTTEIYVDDIEVWNIVFNEWYQNPIQQIKNGIHHESLRNLETKGIDTGMGLERLTVMLQGVPSVFETDLFASIIAMIHEVRPGLEDRAVRVLADHLRASIFLIGDGVRPSNKEAGYILRRLLRRVLVYQIQYDIHGDLFSLALPLVQKIYNGVYPEIMKTKEILSVLLDEKGKFEKAIALGVTEIKKYDEISGEDAFYIYETFGLPWELLKELVPAKVKNLDQRAYDAAFKKHQEVSRAGVEKKFGGHGLLLNTGELKALTLEEVEIVTRLHTATHMLQQALRQVLGNDVKQMGSDITAERTRFDFSFSRKLTKEEISAVEKIINEQIQKDLPVSYEELTIEQAKKTGALYFFKEKYPNRVKVYTIGPELGEGRPFSREFCGGPHVTNTLKIGKFKITKEEAVGSGVRRIRAIVE
ncbi:MAG: alanine--tRNA ligase [bacterium]|nr:alanine--tRNA ligase [bacterium]